VLAATGQLGATLVAEGRPMSLTDLIPTLQLAIGPAILISGVGLISLSMTNRFGRAIDRSRQWTMHLDGAE
jgi:hypothetical protein